MRIFLTVLILIFSLQSCVKADDIRDFQIEGISIEDSALDFFSEDEIKNNLVDWYKDNKFSSFQINRIQNPDIFKTYDNIEISFLTNDKNYKIVQIAASISIKKKNCKKKMKEIENDVSSIFKDYDRSESTINHPVDKTNKSKVIGIYYDFKSNRDVFAIQCYIMSKESNYPSGLKLNIAKNKFSTWLSTVAYN